MKKLKITNHKWVKTKEFISRTNPHKCIKCDCIKEWYGEWIYSPIAVDVLGRKTGYHVLEEEETCRRPQCI